MCVLFKNVLQGSIIHLLLLSIERFLAIMCPFWNKTRSTRGSVIEILSAWLLGILLAIMPSKATLKPKN